MTMKKSGPYEEAAVCFSALVTPIGRLFVGMTKVGVSDVSIGEVSESHYRRKLLARVGSVRKDHAALREVIRQLRAYFDGALAEFALPIDLGTVTPFTSDVLHEARKVDHGQLTTCGEIARRLGRPQAFRAVGGALGRNPIPIIVPCHRVIARGGGLGGFTGGLAIKRALLRLEGHAIPESGGSLFEGRAGGP